MTRGVQSCVTGSVARYAEVDHVTRGMVMWHWI